MAERCDHKWELANEICTGYERLSGKQEARVQAQTLRGAVTDQFEGMSGMLDSLAQELTGIEQAEFPLTDRIGSLDGTGKPFPCFGQCLHRSDWPTNSRSSHSQF